jgi:hypothetical protein
MRFRRLYWVTEQISPSGESEIRGVFTSVPDLIEHCLQVLGETSDVRLSLVELDRVGKPLLTWVSKGGDDIAGLLDPFVKTGELSRDEVQRVIDAVSAISR